MSMLFIVVCLFPSNLVGTLKKLCLQWNCKFKFVSARNSDSNIAMMLSGMLAIRVHALWGLKPQIKYFVMTCWIISSACTLALNVHAIIWMNREIARLSAPVFDPVS